MAGYADLRLSYADCVGGVVARAVRAEVVFGLDDDLRVLGFALEPGWSAAAAGATAAAATARRGRCRACAGAAADRHQREQLDRVQVAGRALGRGVGLGHRAAELERVAALAAAVVVQGHPGLLVGGTGSQYGGSGRP
jgi:hypothetical protein